MANEQQNRNQNQGNNQQPKADEQAHSAPAARDPNKEQKFLVQETAQIARGGSNYTLPKGKTISSHGYDIKALRAQGVKLEEVGA